MKKLIMAVLALNLSFASAGAFATINLGTIGDGCFEKSSWVWVGPMPWNFEKRTQEICVTRPGSNATSVPEIDGAGTMLAFALMGSAALAYRERRRAKKA